MIEKIAVIGAGLMGSGIVLVSASNGFKVVMVDSNQKALANGMSIINSSLERMTKKMYSSDEEGRREYTSKVLGNITTSTLLDSCTRSDLVIEAIVEKLDVKQQLFKVYILLL